MSRIVFLTFGTYGDVAPYVGLGAALAAAGHDVAVAAQQPYEKLITDAGLGYRFLPKDTEQATRDSAAAQAMIDGERMRPSRDMTRELVDQMDGVGPAMVAASRDADLLLACGPVGSMFGYHIAAGMGIPSVSLQLQPLVKTGDFAPPVLTLRSFGRLGNRAIWRLAGVGEKIYLRQINQVRTELGLKAARLGEFQGVRDAQWPVLFGFSERVAPRPTDWRDGLRVTGYWWPPSRPDFVPPPALADFLAAGPPPVFAGFGSTATGKGAELSRIVVDAATRADVRVVLQSGWSQLQSTDDRVFNIGAVPYEWLFPKLGAVIHHAGAGTTAAALRAGIPSIPVPGIMDQPYWSARLVDLGVAPGWRRRRDLDAHWLGDAIRAAVGESRFRERSQELSAALRAEDGIATAMALLERELRLVSSS